MPANTDPHHRPPDDPPLRLVGTADASGPSETPSPPRERPGEPDPTRAGHPSADAGATDRLMHELANLLDGSRRQVGLALGRLSRDAPTEPGEITEHLQTAFAALNRMADLMTGHRPGHARTRNAGFPHDAPLGQVIDHAVRMIQPVAREQRIAIHVELSDHTADLPLGALYPAIVNALRNAVEAIGSEGTITLGAAVEIDPRDRPGLVMGIEDDGPGIHPALPRDEHGLIATGVTTKEAGSGLGLTISRDRVRTLGGELTLEDRLPHGARAVIRLPLHETPARNTPTLRKDHRS